MNAPSSLQTRAKLYTNARLIANRYIFRPITKLVTSFEKSAGMRNATLACLFEHIKVGQGAHARGTNNASGARALTLIPASRKCQPNALLRRSRARVKSTHMTLNSHAHTREHFCCTLQVIRPSGIELRGPTWQRPREWAREGVSRCCLRVPGDIEIANCSYSHARAPPCNLLLLRLERASEWERETVVYFHLQYDRP